MNLAEETISVLVNFYSTLRNLSGIDHAILEVKGKSLIKLLNQIQKQYFNKTELKIMHFDINNQPLLNPEVILLINDVDYRILGDIDENILKNGDKIVIISSVHGG